MWTMDSIFLYLLFIPLLVNQSFYLFFKITLTLNRLLGLFDDGDKF